MKLLEAINLAGGQAALARAIGVRQGHVWSWLNRDMQVPFAHCVSIEASTGVRCEDLRPDVDWDRDDSGTVTGYRVRFPTAAMVDTGDATVESANVAGGAE